MKYNNEMSLETAACTSFFQEEASTTFSQYFNQLNYGTSGGTASESSGGDVANNSTIKKSINSVNIHCVSLCSTESGSLEWRQLPPDPASNQHQHQNQHFSNDIRKRQDSDQHRSHIFLQPIHSTQPHTKNHHQSQQPLTHHTQQHIQYRFREEQEHHPSHFQQQGVRQPQQQQTKQTCQNPQQHQQQQPHLSSLNKILPPPPPNPTHSIFGTGNFHYKTNNSWNIPSISCCQRLYGDNQHQHYHRNCNANDPYSCKSSLSLNGSSTHGNEISSLPTGIKPNFLNSKSNHQSMTLTILLRTNQNSFFTHSRFMKCSSVLLCFQNI